MQNECWPLRAKIMIRIVNVIKAGVYCAPKIIKACVRFLSMIKGNSEEEKARVKHDWE